MPWKECVVIEVRKEFIRLATLEEVNISELCRRFGISRRCGYKWLKRHCQGDAALADRSRRPKASPARIGEGTYRKIVQLRRKHPAWGGRKLHQILKNEAGEWEVPAVSTISRILFRRGMISEQKSAQHRPFIRFEHPQPNDLWQMDFKGHFALHDGSRCHPLTVMDDHSRYCLCLRACLGESAEQVRPTLVKVFENHGLPERILCDNGGPWGTSWPDKPRSHQRYTRLGVWLLRQGVRVCHGRPFHPQTQGKEERLHRTLSEELLQHQVLSNLRHAQRSFDRWREVYNCVRPHEALDLKVPASRYRKSQRAYRPDAKVEYARSDQVRKVDMNGLFHYRGVQWRLGEAFGGEQVALRSTENDGLIAVVYAMHVVAGVDLRQNLGGRGAMCCAEPPVAALPTAQHSTEKVLPMS
jgi:transposase InsO family protein